MRLRQEHLRQKGWTEKEIERAKEVLEEAKLQKHPALALLEKAVFWLLLAITVAGIFAVSIHITPALLFLNDGAVIVILIMLGLCLGTLYTLLLYDIEWLERSHHILGLLLLGITAVMNIAFIVIVMNDVQETLQYGQHHHPLVLGILFAASLLAPYTYHLLVERMRHES